MRLLIVVALVGAGFCAALALDGCYTCDSPGHPRCPNAQPDYPPGPSLEIGASRDAGRE